MFQKCFKSLFSQFQRKRQSQDNNVVFLTWCFSYSAFWLTGQWGGYSPPPPPARGYATGHVIADPDFHRAGPLALWRFSQHLSAKFR